MPPMRSKSKSRGRPRGQSKKVVDPGRRAKDLRKRGSAKKHSGKTETQGVSNTVGDSNSLRQPLRCCVPHLRNWMSETRFSNVITSAGGVQHG